MAQMVGRELASSAKARAHGVLLSKIIFFSAPAGSVFPADSWGN
jgi:hypothetical protein